MHDLPIPPNLRGTVHIGDTSGPPRMGLRQDLAIISINPEALRL